MGATWALLTGGTLETELAEKILRHLPPREKIEDMIVCCPIADAHVFENSAGRL